MFKRWCAVVFVGLGCSAFGADERPETGLELMAYFGCAELKSEGASAETFCAEHAVPTNIVEDMSSASYFFCYEYPGGQVQAMYLIDTGGRTNSAYECAISNPELDCSITNGRFFGLTAAGRDCSYPQRSTADQARRLIERRPSFRGQKICSDAGCDWTKADWSRLAEIPLY